MKIKLITFLIVFEILLNDVNAAVPPSIPQQIKANIAAACRLSDSKNEPDMILGSGQDTKGSFVVTKCPTKLQDKSTKMVISKFYYEFLRDQKYSQENSPLNNVLGVLMPAVKNTTTTDLIHIPIDDVKDYPPDRSNTGYLISTTKFILYSNRALSINSRLRSPDETFVYEDYTHPFIQSISLMPNIFDFNDLGGGDIEPRPVINSTFLKPELTAFYISQPFTAYSSDIKNFYATGGFSFGLNRNTPINTVVYLGVKGLYSSYVFGLKVDNYFAVKDSPYEQVALVCLADSQCTTSSNKLIWNDGSYITISISNVNYLSINFVENYNQPTFLTSEYATD